ncbi:MAG: sugar transferase [Pedobacter sp.]|nr:MAG: sugar transferase [Pedobacter sp.]
MAKRLFDITFSLLGLLLLLPLFIIVAILIAVDSPGGIFYRQRRVGHHVKPFLLWKFRTMHSHADRLGMLTIGTIDQRITRTGRWLRKYKLDELPQLINILLGEMSFVGPRPEVAKYVKYYTKAQLRVLTVKPGLTDLTSLSFFDENELLGSTKDPESLYIKEIIPVKIQQSLSYIDHRSFFGDMSIIFKTITKIILQMN